MEVGNSGMFRPEMLQPMGLPPDVNVIAWGLSLERPTMILYGIDNIRDLFGHKVSVTEAWCFGLHVHGLSHVTHRHSDAYWWLVVQSLRVVCMQ